jgi:hypothetical protein
LVDFASELGRGVKTKHPLDRFVSGFINKLILHYIIKWLDDCFERYTEDYFHLQMRQGFNFMSDMKLNHPKKYAGFMKGARAMRHRYTVDQEQILTAIMFRLKEQGWYLYPLEQQAVRDEIASLVREIYS